MGHMQIFQQVIELCKHALSALLRHCLATMLAVFLLQCVLLVVVSLILFVCIVPTNRRRRRESTN